MKAVSKSHEAAFSFLIPPGLMSASQSTLKKRYDPSPLLPIDYSIADDLEDLST
jgi:hypothetical protein